jgi:hypothetical protein
VLVKPGGAQLYTIHATSEVSSHVRQLKPLWQREEWRSVQGNWLIRLLHWYFWRSLPRKEGSFMTASSYALKLDPAAPDLPGAVHNVSRVSSRFLSRHCRCRLPRNWHLKKTGKRENMP